ncbi:SusC/RagA family TonB-linked outer membrane protein [Cloacibacterium normanense]|uniref:SusC/RagA family TonB-linked outer membrane protein n=1 Tax=Cloacibacterium normanense TaxID=237258 RepID=A0A2S7I8F6_9FLAO|nr:SusC/RagA family TonB-linked outer membrane protein [Cloacibacterium normanense]PPZ92866.1 SusC/RagA family TonB-linked outer membrane protein [Cloacibacterium normanense]
MKKNLISLGYLPICLGLTMVVSSHAYGQQRTVTGTVTSNQKPIAGVSVSQEGKDIVTQTNASGQYQLTIFGDNAILIFRHPLYAETRVTVGNQNAINASLEKEKQIDEVVLNAGYYKVKERESTGSIAKVSAKEIENQPVNNVLSAVQGRMPGVNIVQNSGTPGGGFEIQIRGRNSLRRAGNNPLYIVDGVPMISESPSNLSGTILPSSSINPLNTINPNEIESIEVLKDADATAIYGSRGSNGVVLITTKKALAGKLSVHLNQSYDISELASKMKMMNTEQYLSMRKQAFINSGITVYPANAYDINGTWNQSRYTDWQKEILGHKAERSNTQFTVGGGTERTKFMVNLANSEESTVYGNDFKYRNFNLSNTVSHQSSDKRFEMSMYNLFGKQKNKQMNSDVARSAHWLAPNAPALYTSEGNLNWENNTFTNPLADYNATYINENLQFINNVKGRYTVLSGLNIQLNAGLNHQQFEEWSLVPHTIYNPSYGLNASSSQSYQNMQRRFSFILEPQVEYERTLGSHKLEMIAGASYQSNETKSSYLEGYGFDNNAFIQNIAVAQTKVIGDNLKTEYKYAAFYGRFNYNYQNKYIFNLTGRRDGSSRFGPKNKFANFGAIGMAWIFSKENFLQDSSWLSFGKLRASYGSSGSDNIGDYQYLNNFSTSPYFYNGTVGLTSSRLFNPNFSWEKTVKLEAAIELGFLQDKINFTGAFYRNTSSDQLVGYQLSTVTGFSSVTANLPATVENKGWEFQLATRPLSGTLKWYSDFNISFPANKLLSFEGIEGSSYANTYNIGHSIYAIKLYHLEGINPQTGLYQFTDYNNDGKINAPNDNKIIEDIGVKYFGGWHNKFQYNNWELAFLLQFVKQKNRNYNYLMPIPGGINNQPVEVLNVWSADNPAGMYMPYLATNNASQVLFQNSDAAVSDASFVRLKNLQFSYKIPIRSEVFKTIQIYFQGQNLLTYTKYFGIDPEFNIAGFLPPLRTYSLGLSIKF